MAKTNLVTTTVISSAITAREVDFVTRFGASWEALRDILGVMRFIRKPNGTALYAKTASVTLGTSPAEGEDIPYSAVSYSKTPLGSLTIEKYAKAVSLEAISEYGYDIAVAMSDDEFLNALQSNVMARFYTYLNSGSLAVTGATTFQQALAKVKGAVINKFKTMNKTATDVVAFVNVMDFYNYLGDANITVQNEFGFNYIRNFMGYTTIFLVDGSKVASGTVIATPVENINLYYVDPSDSEFARAGLSYTVEGETNLIGFHTEGNYNTAVSEAFALMGVSVFAEYLDGIAVAEIEGVLPELTVSSRAGGTSGKTALTVSGYTLGTGDSYVYKVTDDEIVVHVGDSTASWTSWNGSAEITATTGKIITVAVSNSSKVVARGHDTVTAKA